MTSEPIRNRVSATDQKVDQAIEAVESAMKGLQMAQAADVKAQGDKVPPEDKAVDEAIQSAFKALNAIKAAQARDEAANPAPL